MRFAVTKRIGVFFLALVLLFTLTFGFLNRPIKTHAEVLSALALGSGALGALVCAYLATAGVQITGGSSDADGSFLGNYVANWVKSSSSFSNNGYFNSDGEFIGNNSDLSIVQNNDTGLVSFIFGKEFAIWLEAIKQSFVSDNSISSTSSVIASSENFIVNDISYPLYNHGSIYSTASWEDDIPSIIPIYYGSNDTFNLSNGYYFTYNITQGNGNYYIYPHLNLYNPSGVLISSSNSYVDNTYNRYSTSQYAGINFVYDNQGRICLGWCVRTNTYDRVKDFRCLGGSLVLDSNSYGLSDMSLEGSLTDGYEDFEDAINNDLTNADEEEVVVVDVGTFPNVLDPSILVPDILDRAIIGELAPEYDGTRENTETAEDEKEGDKPFSPTVPEGWVIVNGLEDFFPFCIPWDLYNLIAELNVPAEAPKFKYKIDLNDAIDGLEYEATLDLAPFETVAMIFRIFICIGFVFFLIMKTRDLIRG